MRSLREFKSDYPMAQTVLIYRGKLREKRGDTLCIPCVEFLRGLDPQNDMAETLANL